MDRDGVCVCAWGGGGGRGQEGSSFHQNLTHSKEGGMVRYGICGVEPSYSSAKLALSWS
jgi:hypothetical protein